MEKLGASLMLLGIGLAWAAVWVWQSMQTKVVRLLEPRVRSPLRDLFDAANRKRVFEEHARFFPESRQREFEKAARILAVVCFVTGFIVLIGFARTSG